MIKTNKIMKKNFKPGLWQLLTDAVYCFTLYPYILNHKYRTHKYGKSVDEKFGITEKRDLDKKCLQIHAVSVGEVIAAQAIIDEFKKKYSNWDIHITVSTATGKEVAKKRYPDIPVSFFPLDLSIWVKRFFSNIQPTAVILMELEIWPNFLEISKKCKIPVIVANGRITEKSTAIYYKYKWVPTLKNMLGIPELWLAQNQEYSNRFIRIGVNPNKVKTTGNIKYDTIPTSPSPDLRDKYRTLFHTSTNSKVIIAGSTHNPEEEIILKSFSELKKSNKDLQLILVPRHPHRFTAVFKLAQSFGNAIKYSQLIQNPDMDNNNEIILIDKMGILSELYNAADIVFIGGSFIEHGGQSMLEPCGLGKPTVIGNSYYNFTEAVNILQESQGILILNTPNELTQKLSELLNNYNQAEKLGQKARTALLQHQGCAKKTIEYLSGIITAN